VQSRGAHPGADLTDAVVEIDNVTKTFDDIVAVDRVSLRVQAGQTLGLIGPNGAGKTTLLRLISSLAKPDSGDVRIQGQSVRDDPRSARRKLGFMPAEFGSPRNLTIFEYLDYFGCMYDIPKADRRRRIGDVCELTDLNGRGDVMVKGLSTGNRQRLLLAKTLLHDPGVLVLDEPASGLDPRARTELRAIVRELAAMGKTIIISSHILPDIEEISDRIGILEAGKLVLDGDLETLRAHHGATRRVVKLRVPAEDTAHAADVLAQLAGVTSCERRDQFLVIGSDEPNGNFILAELLRHDIRILRFAEDEPNLEEIFMRSTAGKVT
jgi:ABC-2 type transport system ATP-binding protein